MLSKRLDLWQIWQLGIRTEAANEKGLPQFFFGEFRPTSATRWSDQSISFFRPILSAQ